MADWFPQPTGNTQYDENQRKVWENLYYLRDQKTPTASNQNAPSGMSGTAFFVGGFTIGNKTFHSMTFQDGRLVATS